jgi:hypothetical protein
LFHYYGTGITPAMAAAKAGSGSAYAIAFRDVQGRYLDGGKTYKITLPAPIPVGQFWSFAVYDNPMTGKGWNVVLRLYAPLQPWFDKTWRPGDFEEVL